MRAIAALDKSDVQRLMALLNRLHAGRDAGADARWRTLLDGVCRLVGATGGVMAMADAAGGWDVTHRLGLPSDCADLFAGDARHPRDPALRNLLRRGRTLRAGATLTLTRAELVRDAPWYASAHVREIRRPLMLDDGVYSALAVSASARACVCVCRAWNRRRRAFADREKHLVDLAHQGCAWVYRGHVSAAAVDALPLSPREKQTLRKLLTGRAEKHVAAEMGLSVNTVHHYAKEIYKLLGVSSRAELLAKWMTRDA